MMDSGFAAATRAYHAWLHTRVGLLPAGLAEKRRKLRGRRFPFLRGTFHRWPACFATLEPQLQAEPRILSVGDVHLENFGTWRDAEGRLAWGVNDFDEAAELPWPSDLVRLATSIRLARRDSKDDLTLKGDDAIDAVLRGYATGLRTGRPLILEEENSVLRDAALKGFRPNKEWPKLRTAGCAGEPEPSLRDLLLTSMPEGAISAGFRQLVTKGLGSLGRPRWLLLASWHGGALAREAKAAAPSAVAWSRSQALDGLADHRRIAALARRARSGLPRGGASG
jgi:hypothetical protein